MNGYRGDGSSECQFHIPGSLDRLDRKHPLCPIERRGVAMSHPSRPHSAIVTFLVAQRPKAPTWSWAISAMVSLLSGPGLAVSKYAAIERLVMDDLRRSPEAEAGCSSSGAASASWYNSSSRGRWAPQLKRYLPGTSHCETEGVNS